MRLPELLVVLALLIILFGLRRVFHRGPEFPGAHVKATEPNRSRTLLVMIAFAILWLVAMATQHARIGAGQVLSTAAQESRR